MDLGTAVQQYGYPAVFVGGLLEGETVLALAGLAAHRFAIGRRYGARLLERYPHRGTGQPGRRPARAVDALQRLLGDLERIEHWNFGALLVTGIALWLARRRLG
jgi:hypothetical protein